MADGFPDMIIPISRPLYSLVLALDDATPDEPPDKFAVTHGIVIAVEIDDDAPPRLIHGARHDSPTVLYEAVPVADRWRALPLPKLLDTWTIYPNLTAAIDALHLTWERLRRGAGLPVPTRGETRSAAALFEAQQIERANEQRHRDDDRIA